MNLSIRANIYPNLLKTLDFLKKEYSFVDRNEFLDYICSKAIDINGEDFNVELYIQYFNENCLKHCEGEKLRSFAKIKIDDKYNSLKFLHGNKHSKIIKILLGYFIYLNKSKSLNKTVEYLLDECKLLSKQDLKLLIKNLLDEI